MNWGWSALIGAIVAVAIGVVLHARGSQRAVTTDGKAAIEAPASAGDRASSAPAAPGPLEPPQRAPAGRRSEAPLDDALLMARLRSVAPGDPSRAIELAREGKRRFPDSPAAAERASILIHALAAEGDARGARGEAEYAVNHYPDSSWVREIEGFTGAHRHRNLVLTDGGQIQFQ